MLRPNVTAAMRLTREADRRRDAFEFPLVERAFAKKIPIFAVCRGMQIVNVFFKGTLIEDLRFRSSADGVIHDQVTENNVPYSAYAHEITIEPASLLHTVVGSDRIRVNSIHHQAIAQLGEGLCTVAHAGDGVVEAIELQRATGQFLLGVQWHPEWLPDDPVTARLYQHFLRVVGFGMPELRNG